MTELIKLMTGVSEAAAQENQLSHASCHTHTHQEQNTRKPQQKPQQIPRPTQFTYLLNCVVWVHFRLILCMVKQANTFIYSHASGIIWN